MGEFFKRPNGSFERSANDQSITRDGICRHAIQSSRTRITRPPSCSRDPAGGKFMSTIFKIIIGTAIAAAGIASPALAQYASEKGKLISVRHSGHVKAGS